MKSVLFQHQRTLIWQSRL